MAVLEADAVTVEKRGRHILRDVDLEAPPDEEPTGIVGQIQETVSTATTEARAVASTLTPLQQLAGGLALVALFGVLYVARARGYLPRLRSHPDPSPTPPDPTHESGDGAPSSTGPYWVTAAETAVANEQWRDGIQLAYAAVRDALGDSRAATHWEFLEEHRRVLDDDAASRLEALTTTYELAAYSMTAPTGEQAVDALETAKYLLDGDDTR